MPAQAHAFAAALCAGAASALVYDALRFVRRALSAGAFATGALDLLFWAAAAAFTSCAGAFSGVKGLRLYMLAGALCGFLLWEAGVRRAALAAGGALRRLTGRNKRKD